MLLLLHGLGSSGDQMLQLLELDRAKPEHEVLVAAPNGTVDGAGRRFWNAGPECCNFDGRAVDDVRFLASVIRRGVARGADPARVVVLGYSNGGFMAHRLACAAETAPLLAGIVSMAGVAPSVPCESKQPIALLQVHGDRDPIVPYAGGSLFGSAALPRVRSSEATIASFAVRNRCEGGSTLENLDFEARVVGAETQMHRHRKCAAPVELWTVRGAEHYLAPSPTARARLWEFVLSARRT